MKPAYETDHGPAKDATELNRLFEEAIRRLKGTDLPAANTALKKAHAEVASAGGAASEGRETVTGSEDRR